MKPKHDVLLLFDLDGVVFNSGGLPERFPYAIGKVFRIKTHPNEKHLPGQTEPEALLEVGMRYGLKKQDIQKHVQELFDTVTEFCKKNMNSSNMFVLKGAPELLKELKKRQYVICTATGNNPEMTRIKLEMRGLKDIFDLIGTSRGLDHRNDILLRTVKEAETKFNRRYPNSKVLYFGDSPFDVEGARECGFKVVSVASGKYSFEDLKKLNPDYIVNGLSEIKKVFEIIADFENK